jgi:type II secretory pathway component PulC
MVEDDSSWRKWLSQMRVAMPISLEAIIASLVVTMVLMVMLIKRIREPNKEVCHRSRGCDSPLQSKAKPPSGS